MGKLLRAAVAATLALVTVSIGNPVQLAAASAHSTVDARAYRVQHTTGIYATDLWQFSSPSGNIRCQVGSLEDSHPFSCVAIMHSWKAPKLPILSQGCKHPVSGALYTLQIGEGFYAVCKESDPGMLHRGKRLPAGKTIEVEGVTCTSLSGAHRDGMACTAPNRTSLYVTKSTLRFSQPRGWEG